jgi:hypothetical protein
VGFGYSHLSRKNRQRLLSLPLIMTGAFLLNNLLFLLPLFTALIAHSTRSFTGRLARGLAFATAAFFNSLTQYLRI